MIGQLRLLWPINFHFHCNWRWWWWIWFDKRGQYITFLQLTSILWSPTIIISVEEQRRIFYHRHSLLSALPLSVHLLVNSLKSQLFHQPSFLILISCNPSLRVSVPFCVKFSLVVATGMRWPESSASGNHPSDVPCLIPVHRPLYPPRLHHYPAFYSLPRPDIGPAAIQFRGNLTCNPRLCNYPAAFQ